MIGTATEETETLPTTPRFGVWVLAAPIAESNNLGQLSSASPVLFCHLDADGRPKCVAGPIPLTALSVHVLWSSPNEPAATAPTTIAASAATPVASPTAETVPAETAIAPAATESSLRRVTHVLWGQPAGGGLAVRCEADEVGGTVTCQAATEKLQP